MPQNFPNPWILTVPSTDAKLKVTLDYLKSQGVAATPFSGFDGAVSGLHTVNPYERDGPGSGCKMGSKHLCMALGHIVMWKCFLHRPGTETCWTIFEDDVRFIPDWQGHLDFAIRNLPADWDMYFPGSCCCADHNPRQINGSLYKIKYCNCTHCYIVRWSALPTLIEKCAKFGTPIDIQMAVEAFPKLNVYATLPRLAYQLDTIIPP